MGAILAASGVRTIEFRASIIIGSGSLSFEMIRALVERLPLMVTPRWVLAQAQPIAIEDVIAYLRAALEFEMGGSAGRVQRMGSNKLDLFCEARAHNGSSGIRQRLSNPVD